MRNITYEVELNMFAQGEIRKVEVPVTLVSDLTETNLSTIYYYGQNDIQAQKLPSVSMGDVIRYNDKRYLVLAVGFRELKDGEVTVGFILPVSGS
jgi:hypothetical protein